MLCKNLLLLPWLNDAVCLFWDPASEIEGRPSAGHLRNNLLCTEKNIDPTLVVALLLRGLPLDGCG